MKNPIKQKSFEFSLLVITTYKTLVNHKKEYVMSKQLLRSGTAVGALYSEAEHAESKADFIHKLSVAQKECNETIYWLKLLKASNYMEPKEFKELHSPATELMKLLTSILRSTKKNTV